MSGQISAICKSVNFHIRNLWRIRKFITREACHHAVRALVLSRIDYANSLLYGAKQTDLQRLQRLQNKAARLVFACGRDQSLSHLLVCHTFYVPFTGCQSRTESSTRSCCMFINLLITRLRRYLTDILKLYNASNSTEYSRRRLRSSSDATRLAIPRSKRQAGDNSFHVCGPWLWNRLPVSIREAPSVTVFKSQLKTHLFPKY